MRELGKGGTGPYQLRDLIAVLTDRQQPNQTPRVSPKQQFRSQRLARPSDEWALEGTFELRWMQAHNGNADAQSALGEMYARGVGTRQSDGEAIRWHHLAAEQGHAASQLYLGNAYCYGRGVPQNHAAGIRWLKLSAENGCADAQYRLASMLDHEPVDDISPNYADAAKWYQLAANQGHIEAQHRLGSIYATGRGLAQNDVLAHMWFEIAAKRGQKASSRSLRVIANMMSSDEIDEARRLADGWKPSSSQSQDQIERRQ